MMKLKLAIFATLLLPFTTNAYEISKFDWYEEMSIVLPKLFCSSSQYFRQCFSVSEQKCVKTAASVLIVCLNESEKDIPSILVQPEDGERWGTIIGECADEAYEIRLATKRIHSTKCSDINNWL